METQALTRREARFAKRRRPTTITIPSRVSPHVRLVFEEMRRQGVTYDRVEEMSGVLRTTLKAWRHRNKPGLESIEAVLGALGWDFVPIPRAKVLPKALVEDLKVVAETHGQSIEKALEALIELVANVHERFPYRKPPWPRPVALKRRSEDCMSAPSTAPTLADASTPL